MDINPSSEPRRRERRLKRPNMVQWNKRNRPAVEGMDANSATACYWSRATGDEPCPASPELCDCAPARLGRGPTAAGAQP